MGNTIKNFEKKKRKEYKEACREVQKFVYDSIVEKCPGFRVFEEIGTKNLKG